MRIMHLCPSLTGGGAERQLCYLSRELGHRGHEVHVVVFNAGPNIELLREAKNVYVHVLGQGKSEAAPLRRSLRNYSPAILAKVFSTLRSLRPDIVQTWILQMDIVGGLAATLNQVPWILREPISALRYSGSGIKVNLRTWVGKRARTIVANSNAGANYWATVSPRLNRVVIRNGIPLEELVNVAPLRHPEIQEGMPLVLYAGRFTKQKNVERTLRGMIGAISSLRAQAILCGEGPLRGPLERMLAEFPGEPRIKLWEYQKRLWPLMKRADVFVSASHCEGCPNTVMEAMACGCPLVVSDIPEHRELLSNDTAEFVDDASFESIKNGIVRVLSNRKLAQMRAQLAQSIVEQFSIEEMTNCYEAVYESVTRPVG